MLFEETIHFAFSVKLLKCLSSGKQKAENVYVWAWNYQHYLLQTSRENESTSTGLLFYFTCWRSYFCFRLSLNANASLQTNKYNKYKYITSMRPSWRRLPGYQAPGFLFNDESGQMKLNNKNISEVLSGYFKRLFNSDKSKERLTTGQPTVKASRY